MTSISILQLLVSLSSLHGALSMHVVAGGAVFTATLLDYEDRPSYTIIVQATDTPGGMESRYV